MPKSVLAVVVALAATLITPVAHAGVVLDPNAVPSRTQLTLRYSDGVEVATANAHESRPALSLAKLYLGYWVVQHGEDADKARVENMIRYSEDATASYLDTKYHQAIPEVIAQYGLSETHYPGYWGNTTTSTEDLTRFLSDIVADPVAAPVINGMRTAAPTAADGYRQDYGTSRVPGVIGTKFAWADDASTVNASASFGDGFTIAANTYGDSAQLTGDVLGAVRWIDNPPVTNATPAVSAPSPRLPSAFESQVIPFIPAQFQGQARAVIRSTEDSIAAERQQVCSVIAQAGSSTQAGFAQPC